MNGFLNLLKPPGMTSHDVVDFVRRRIGKQHKVGHLGTLDPAAAGVLPLAIGEATRLISKLPPARKIYVAEVAFGLTSDTLDAEGVILPGGKVPENLRELCIPWLKKFSGTIMQIPPRVSALRREGKRGYERARGGEEFEFEARPAHYHEVRLLRHRPSRIFIWVDCGPGTYVRSLARDLGEEAGCGALLSYLLRVRSGPFEQSEAHTLEDLLRESVPSLLLDCQWPFRPQPDLPSPQPA